jgi:hypothetical protein
MRKTIRRCCGGLVAGCLLFISQAGTLAPPCLAQGVNGFAAGDTNGTWNAGSLSVAIIPQAALFAGSNDVVGFLVQVTNNACAGFRQADITNLATAVGGNPLWLSGTASSQTPYATNVDWSATNETASAIACGTTNAPAPYGKQIDNLTEDHTVWGWGLYGGQASGIWAVYRRKGH